MSRSSSSSPSRFLIAGGKKAGAAGVFAQELGSRMNLSMRCMVVSRGRWTV